MTLPEAEPSYPLGRCTGTLRRRCRRCRRRLRRRHQLERVALIELSLSVIGIFSSSIMDDLR